MFAGITGAVLVPSLAGTCMGNTPNEGSVDLGAVLEDELRYVFEHGPRSAPAARRAGFESGLSRIRAASNGRDDGGSCDAAAVRELVLGDPNLRVTGIAFSGGGIRSASFGLGVQQALARVGLLSKFDFMSGVSGGGYVLGWLLTWAYRTRGGLPAVEQALADPRAATEPAPIRHLRRYVVYLAPHLGALSPDLWGLLAAYFRNLAVSLMFALPLILLPVLVVHIMFAVLRFTIEQHGAWWQYFGFAAMLVLATAEITAMRVLASQARTRVWRDDVLATRHLLWLHLTLGVTLAALYLLVPRPALEWPDAVKVTLSLLVFGAVGWIGGRLGRRRTGGERDGAEYGTLREVIAGLLSAIAFVACTGVFHALLGSAPGAPPIDLLWRLPFVALAWSATIVTAEFIHQLLHSKDMTDVDREWTIRFTGVLLLGSLCWLVGIGLVLCVPAWLLAVEAPLAKQIAAATLVLLCVTAGVLRWHGVLYAVACLVLVEALCVKVFALIDPLDSLEGLRNGLLSTALGMVAIGMLIVLVDRLVNINRFSLHSVYRNRLCRAFLGASRPERADDRRAAPEERAQFRPREAGRFQDFDAHDNPRLRWLKLREGGPQDAGWMPVAFFNASLNSTWMITEPGRPPKAYPFAFSQFYCGSPETGYCATEDYSSTEGGVSLGTAMATSGAAVSSLSGRLDNRLLAFVKTVFNLRLGWWLGNPNDPRCRVAAAPRYSMVAFCAELFGTALRTRDWINLSDGGHFENMGVFPLLQRGCRDIVAIDSTADPKRSATDLATLVRVARAELNVDIVLDSSWHIGTPALGERGRHCALFRVVYPGGHLGRLLYVKPSLYEGGALAPVDVLSYSMGHPAFPHESTMNQFFSEAQFESYRRLGEETIRALLGDAAHGSEITIDTLFSGARRHLGPTG